MKELATSHDIPVLTPTSLRDNDEFRSELRRLKPDCVPVVAYGESHPPRCAGFGPLRVY